MSTRQFHGIDLRPFAVEVAKVTLMLARKLAADELGDERTSLPLNDLDANLQTANAVTATWPAFDVCISNPPYLGAKNILDRLMIASSLIVTSLRLTSRRQRRDRDSW